VADFSDSNLYHQHYFPGAVSLFEDLDKDVMLDLRDGRKIFGTFRSFDQVECDHLCIHFSLIFNLQFANIMLERCVERLYDSASSSFFVYSPHCASSFCHSHRQYADESLGFLIVRGENVAMMGLMGAVSRPPEIVGYKLVSVSEIKTVSWHAFPSRFCALFYHRVSHCHFI
jgi:small nuclear ribonucleoprotein (snRNP)-like protein